MSLPKIHSINRVTPDFYCHFNYSDPDINYYTKSDNILSIVRVDVGEFNLTLDRPLFDPPLGPVVGERIRITPLIFAGIINTIGHVKIIIPDPAGKLLTLISYLWDTGDWVQSDYAVIEMFGFWSLRSDAGNVVYTI